MKSSKMSELMDDPVTIDKNASLSEALEIMKKEEYFELPVTHKDVYLGTLTYRDLARELGSISKQSKPPSNLHVSTAYQKDGGNLKKEDDFKEGVCSLADRGNYTLPILNENSVIGVFKSEKALKSINFNEDLRIKEVISDNYEVISPNERVVHARRKLLDKDLDLLAVKQRKDIIGSVTDIEIAKGMASFRELVPDKKQDSRIRNLLVEDILNNNTIIIDSKTNLNDLIKEINSNKIRDIIVEEENELKGSINQLDILESWCENARQMG
ncbi:MAG: Protein containing two CBS domain [Candidatus Methanohalarchaeum thermophilum]|uniref:Protein containing two CBS domain n=1 Tax=Methanohalarchaeum thermophilum TaxID=1903181 RepID=A0A1Q6DV11_METT1|nr:MAG: Protein containing two CBS domain [Candidatus Methanohalarchaeum thermophilum]